MKKEKTRIVKLLKPHTHNGVMYGAGVELELPLAQAEWLQQHYLDERGDTAAEAAKVEGTPEHEALNG